MTLMTQEAPASVANPAATRSVVPGATIGMFGSGQLGRMFTQAAQRLGYRVHVFSTHEDSPTGQVADREITARFEDLEAVRRFAADVEVVTLEFENVPVEAVKAASQHAPVRPSAAVLHTVQHRLREKQFLQRTGIACTPFWVHGKLILST